ncbi:unnamed protein product [Cyclocybe aegerita]|uniref:Uncharacterized protein n=1 Tax=Cyclocybe aegerita TaxID=1973307 RepID=A0A8S0VXE0_CYCAE|nr:unnamed protein product [Cyclocybe aegerita]
MSTSTPSHLRHPNGAPHHYHYRLNRLSNAPSRPVSMCESPIPSVPPHELAPVKILNSLSPNWSAPTSSAPSAWSNHRPSPSIHSASKTGTIPKARSRSQTPDNRPVLQKLQLHRSTVVHYDYDEPNPRPTPVSRTTPIRTAMKSNSHSSFVSSSSSPSLHSLPTPNSTSTTMNCRERPAPLTIHAPSSRSSHVRHESSPATLSLSTGRLRSASTPNPPPFSIPQSLERGPISSSRVTETFHKSSASAVLVALNPVLDDHPKHHQERAPSPALSDQSTEEKRRNSDATASSPGVFGEIKYLLPELGELSPITLNDLTESPNDPSSTPPSTPSISLDSKSISEDSDSLFDDDGRRGSPMIPLFASSRPTSFLSDRTLLTRNLKRRRSVIVTLTPAEESNASLEGRHSVSSWRHRRYSEWSGEWNQPDIQEVIQKLRSLK